MLDQRCSKVGRRERADKCQDVFELIERQPQGLIGGREGWVKRRRNAFKLHKRRMRNAGVKCAKALFPIGQAAQHRKGGRRANALHSVAVANHVAAATIGKGKALTLCGAPPKYYGCFSSLQSFDWRKNLCAINLELRNSTPSNIGIQPSRKAPRFVASRRICRCGLQVKNLPQPAHQPHTAFGRNDHLGVLSLQCNLNACFQGKPWQQEAQKTAFLQGGGTGKAKAGLLWRCRDGQPASQNNQSGISKCAHHPQRVSKDCRAVNPQNSGA